MTRGQCRPGRLQEGADVQGLASGGRQQPDSLQPGNGAFAAADGLKAGDGMPAVGDQDRFAAFHLLDQPAELILRCGNFGRLDVAKLAIIGGEP